MQTDLSDLHRQLERLAASHDASLDSLLALLEAEKDCMHTDAARLNAINADKQPYIAQLERLGSELNRLLSNAGFGADATGLDACLQNAPAKLVQEWDALREKIKHCQEINVRNGALVELSRQRARQLLSILLGDQPGTGTYDKEGKSNHRPGSGSMSFKA